VAAFALVAALAVEFVLIRDEITVRNARRLLTIDAVYGAAAGLVLTVGLLRVFFFEKGAGYYFHSIPFIGKLSLFIAIGLLSIYPTRTFVSWRSAVRRNEAPAVDPDRVRRVRRIIHWELAAVVGILLCAALMARGIGFAASR
jgi:putative membrane protein